jgi:acyl carrier protein
MSALQDFDQSFDEVLEDILGLDLEIRDDDGPGSVEGWDSLSHVRLIHALETRFAVRLPDAALLEEPTAGALKVLIREQLAGF